MNGPDTRCIKHTQAKRGGHRCSEPAVHDGLCRLHLLLAHTGESKCPFIAKTGRPCTHHVVEGLKTCVFHVDDASFTTWLQRLRSTTAQQQPSTTEVDTSTSTSQLDRLFTTLDDPDLEDELLDTVALQQLPHVRSSLAALEVDWSPRSGVGRLFSATYVGSKGLCGICP